MWQHYTVEAQTAVWEAIYEARRFGRAETEPLHLLSGLLHPQSGTVAELLCVVGTSPAILRERMEPLLEDGEAVVEQPPCSPRVRRAIQFAYEEAAAMDDRFYGADHLLLGLLREENAANSRQLLDLGLELTQARKIVLGIRTGKFLEPGSVQPSSPPPTALYAWDRYDETAQRILFKANDLAQTPEAAPTAIHLLHLLHVLLGETEPRLFQALQILGVSPGEIIREIERQRAWSSGASELFVSTTGLKLGEWASREANVLGSPLIRPEHLLLAILQTDRMSAAPLLGKFGVTEGRIRETLRGVPESNPPSNG